MIREGFGEIIGEKVVRPVYRKVVEKIGEQEVEISGLENIENIPEGQSVIFASNHLKPESALQRQSGFALDAMIIDKTISEHTGRKLRIVAKYDDGWDAGEKLGSAAGVAQRSMKPFRRGLYKGLGMIPVEKDPKRNNRPFIEEMTKAIDDTELILIFPEGDWREDGHDFSQEINIQKGASHFAKKKGVPIIPIYISGAHKINSKRDAKLSFGEPILPENLTQDEINLVLAEKIIELQRKSEAEKFLPGKRLTYLNSLVGDTETE